MRFWLKIDEQKLIKKLIIFKIKPRKKKHISRNHYILPIVLYKRVEIQKIQKLLNVIKSFNINPIAKQACKKNLVTI